MRRIEEDRGRVLWVCYSYNVFVQSIRGDFGFYLIRLIVLMVVQSQDIIVLYMTPRFNKQVKNYVQRLRLSLA